MKTGNVNIKTLTIRSGSLLCILCIYIEFAQFYKNLLQIIRVHAILIQCPITGRRSNIGMSPSGKAPDFDSGIRRFKSCHPSQYDPLAQPVEQLPFKQWVRGSSPRRVTKKTDTPTGIGLFA